MAWRKPRWRSSATRRSRPRARRPDKLKTGTEVRFHPSKQTFTKTEFDYGTLEHRLRELAFLNSGVFLNLTDSRHSEIKSVDLHYQGGIEAFVKYLDRTKQALHEPPGDPDPTERDGITVETCRLEWNDSAITRTPCVLPTTSPSATAAPISPVSAAR